MLMRWRTAAAALWICIGLLSSGAVLAESVTPIPPGISSWPAKGSITYDVLYGENGIKIGEARHQWQHDKQRYSMQTLLETTGMANMLYDIDYVQHSEGAVLPDGLRPDSFRVEQSGRPTRSADFDWQTGKVVLSRKGKRTEADILAGDQDVLSVWHLLGTRGAREAATKLNLITERRATASTVEVLKYETLTLPGGPMETLHARIIASTGKLSIDLWLARGHNLLPVRILITDDKDRVFDQQMTAMTLGAPSAAADAK